MLAVLTAFAGAQAFAVAENIPDSDAFYWALSTMTTVGYGDVTPTTGAGKVIAVTVMRVGIGFVAILTGAIAQRFIAPQEERIESDERPAREGRRTSAPPVRLSGHPPHE